MSLFLQGDRLIEKFSKTKHLPAVTFFVAFFEATISPILPEAFLLIVLAYRKDVSWKLLSFVSALGSSFGALVMYILGLSLYNAYGKQLLQFLHGEAFAEKAKLLFEQNVFVTQFFAALTPLPDRVFSFLAGAFVVSPVIFFIATFAGRLVRVVPIAYLSYEYGDEARDYIKKHRKHVSIGIGVFILAYILYKYLWQ